MWRRSRRAVEHCSDRGCEAGLPGSVGGGEEQDGCASGGRLATMACSPEADAPPPWVRPPCPKQSSVGDPHLYLAHSVPPPPDGFCAATRPAPLARWIGAPCLIHGLRRDGLCRKGEKDRMAGGEQTAENERIKTEGRCGGGCAT
jgi:hypothetical protein